MPMVRLPSSGFILNEDALSSESVPSILQDQLRELEEWAQEQKQRAGRDAVSFWFLKIPAIVASASAGVWAHFGLVTVSVLAGAIASLCVIIDSVHPRGMLRNVHMRAYHDIRILASNMAIAWRSRDIRLKPENAARQIIRDAESGRQVIAGYVRDAETALRYEDRYEHK